MIVALNVDQIKIEKTDVHKPARLLSWKQDGKRTVLDAAESVQLDV